MFKTENLVGRLHYETDKVVCINVYLKEDTSIFVTQALYSIVNGQIELLERGVHHDEYGYLSKESVRKEVLEGVVSYLEIRRKLGLPVFSH